jgi:hypothetical protein
MEHPVWTDDALRAEGLVTDVETAGSVLKLSRTQAYARVKDGTFPVPVIPVGGNRLVVPVAPLLRLLKIDTNTPGEAVPAAIDPERLADIVAERVVNRLATAMAGAARADPLPGPATSARLQSVADSGGADAAA